MVDNENADVNNIGAVPKVPIHEVIAQLRKFNGHSDAREFISRFKYDLRAYALSFEWGLRNFDRALEGDASAWWSSKWHQISDELDDCDQDAEFQRLFEQVEYEFLRFFDNSSQQSIYRRENKTLKFNLGDCPTHYVTQKLKILRLIDANMNEEKKVTQLLKGLPYDLRQTLTLQGVDSINILLDKLRSLSEMHDEQRDTKRNSTNQSSIAFPGPNQSSSSRNYSRNNFAPRNQVANFSGYSRNAINSHSAPVNTFTDQVGPTYPKGKNMYTNDGKPICNYCHHANHVTRNCQELNFRNQRRNFNNSNMRQTYQPQNRNSDPQYSQSRNFQTNFQQNSNFQNPNRLHSLVSDQTQDARAQSLVNFQNSSQSEN